MGLARAPTQSFVDVIADELPLALGRSVQVVNLGRNGGNSIHAARMVLDTVDGLQPDALVVLVGLNNGQNLQGDAHGYVRAFRGCLGP